MRDQKIVILHVCRSYNSIDHAMRYGVLVAPNAVRSKAKCEIVDGSVRHIFRSQEDPRFIDRLQGIEIHAVVCHDCGLREEQAEFLKLRLTLR